MDGVIRGFLILKVAATRKSFVFLKRQNQKSTNVHASLELFLKMLLWIQLHVGSTWMMQVSQKTHGQVTLLRILKMLFLMEWAATQNK